MSNPFFSIILPTYNREKHLKAAINSVLAQSYTNWELIIVDDGSTDDSKNIIKTISINEPRVKYIYQENQERSVARNNGIKHSNGDFICFLDSDDEYGDNHLESLLDKIESTKNKFGLFCTDATVFENDMKLFDTVLKKPSNTNLQSFLFYYSLIPDRVCIKREILDELMFDPEIKISEDTDLWVRIVCKYPQLILTNEATINYKKHNENSVNYKHYNAYSERKKTLQKLLHKNGVVNIDSLIAKKTINDCNMGIFKFYFYQKKYFKAWTIIILSLLEYPTYRSKEKIYLAMTCLFKRDYKFIE